MNAYFADATKLVTDPSRLNLETLFAAQKAVDALVADEERYGEGDFAANLDSGQAHVRACQSSADEVLVDVFLQNSASGAYVLKFVVTLSDEGASVESAGMLF